MILRIKVYLVTWLLKLKERLAKSPVVYRLVSGAFWSLLGGVASRIFSMISSIVAARLIGKEGFGELGMINSTMGLFGVFAGFGLGSTATKYIAEYRQSNPDKAGSISNLTLIVSLASSGIIAILCVFMSEWLANETLHHPESAELLKEGALLLFYSTLNGVLMGALSGFEAFRRVARINIYQGLSAPLFTIPLTYFYGVAGAIASLTVNAALGTLLCATTLRNLYKEYSISAKYTNSVWSEWPVLWKFALPAMLSGLLVAPATWLTNLFLINQHNGYGELGLFNAANQWRAIIIFLPTLLTSVMLPILSDVHGQNNKTDFIKTVTLNLQATWIICLPLTICVVALNKPLSSIFGNSFDGSAPVLAILMVSCFLMVVNNTVGTALASSGRMWTGLAMNMGWGTALIAGSYLLIPSMGAQGLAAAYLIAYLFHTVWQMLYVEIKLAPSAISSQWKLILFSFILMTASIFSALTETGTIIISVILFLLSLSPVFQFWFVVRNLNIKPLKAADEPAQRDNHGN